MDKTRRELLLSGAAALGKRLLPISLGAAAATRSGTVPAQGGLPARIEFDPAPFTLGVASGDPTPSSVIIWTRYAPDPLDGQGGMTSDTTVWWAVATDPSFSIPSLVNMGPVPATVAGGGAVHVDVTGLDPDTVYYYMFWDLQQTTSVVGTTKTTPSGSTGSARFAFVSCQSIESGRYAAFENLVAENLDFAVHLGDAIYEKQLSTAWPAAVRPEPTDLESYRVRHALYRGDPQLRAAYQNIPWIMNWDDHEALNGYWALPVQAWIDRRNDAYQAWYEHMPIRPPAGPPGPSGFQIYRKLAYGDLLDVIVMDCRQYRDAPSCSRMIDPVGCPNPDMYDPNRTMLGSTQKQWLLGELSGSTVDWRCLGSALVMADVKVGGVVGYTEIWQGYAAERQDILEHLDTNNIDNTVVISGDWHRSMAANLKLDFDDIAPSEIATEFACPGMTSVGGPDVDGFATFYDRLINYPLNLHLRFWEVEQQGYVVCDVTPQTWTSTFRTVDRTDPNATSQTLAVFEVASGVPQVNMVSGTGENPFPPNDA